MNDFLHHLAQTAVHDKLLSILHCKQPTPLDDADALSKPLQADS